MRLTLLLLVALVAGCSHPPTPDPDTLSLLNQTTSYMPVINCKDSNWAELGQTDGQAGLRKTRLMAYRSLCAQQRVPVDRRAYLAGWEKGNATYCDVRNAYALGLRGAPHTNACPFETRSAFITAYREGKRVHNSAAELEI